MDYFHRRNRPPTEFSGYEEASSSLRQRILHIIDEYVCATTYEGHYLRRDKFKYRCNQQFTAAEPKEVIKRGTYDQVFTLVEVLSDYANNLDAPRRNSLIGELAEAFRLSGSVYVLRRGRLELIPSEETARKLQEISRVLEPYQDCAGTFFAAVGDLMGRKRKPDDIVKDLFVGAEGYLKKITGENDFGSAVKALNKEGVLNTIQRGVMEKLYGYRSDARGVGHAGNSPTPTERDALWFLETLLAQLAHIHRSSAKA